VVQQTTVKQETTTDARAEDDPAIFRRFKGQPN